MASIFLANLDADAIGLGASCTRPDILNADRGDVVTGRKRITLEADDAGDSIMGFTPMGPIQGTTTGTAQISVSDCLACSGCVTSAESVLLAEQAAPKLALLCLEGTVDVVLDRAALASVAQKFDSTPAEALARLRQACSYAPNLSVRRVVAATDAQDLQLLEKQLSFPSTAFSLANPILTQHAAAPVHARASNMRANKDKAAHISGAHARTQLYLMLRRE